MRLVEIAFFGLILVVLALALTTEGDGGGADDSEAQLAALAGDVDEQLDALGVPAEARKDKTIIQRVAMLRKAVAKQKEYEAKKGVESADLAAQIKAQGEQIAALTAMRTPATDISGAEAVIEVEEPPEPIERKMVHPEETSGEPGPGVDGMEHKSMLEALGDSDIWFRPSRECLLQAPAEQAAEICDMPLGQVQGLRKLNDHIVLTGSLLRQSSADPAIKGAAWPEVVRSLKSFRLYEDELAQNQALRKALDTATATEGAEWVPTEFSRELFDRVELERKLAPFFRTIPMPQNPYTLPVRGTRGTAYLAAESTADAASAITATTPQTANTTLTAAKIAARVVFSDELDEDSVIPILPFVEEEIVLAIAHGIENCSINGDTQSTHFDSGYTVAASDVRRAWIGLRRMANQQTSAAAVDLTTMSVANLLALKGEMGTQGYGISNLGSAVWVCGIDSYIALMGLDECQTVDQYGPRAVIREGELAQLMGSSVIVSEHVGQNLNDDGIYDASSITATILLYVYAPAIVYGRRSSKVESDRIVETQQTQVVGALRITMVPLYDAASNNIVGLGHSI